MTQEAMKLALEALKNNKLTHLYCEDTWYSCPKHEDGCANEAEGDKCNCGADDVNAQFDQAITALEEALAQTQEPVAHWSDCAVHSEPAYPKGECDCGGIVAVADYTALSDKYVALSDKYVALKAQRTWVGLMRGVRVDGDTVVITVKGGNDVARKLCGELLKEKIT